MTIKGIGGYILAAACFAAALAAFPAVAQDSFYSEIAPHLLSRGKATKDQVNKSAGLFKEALKLYKEDKKPAESLELFRKSILLMPDGEKYQEMGNALMDAGKYDEAILSYKAALRWESADRRMALYNMACASSLLNKVEDSLGYLEKAFKNHYADFEFAKKDPDLKSVQASPKFQKLVAAYDNTVKLPQVLIGLWHDSPLLGDVYGARFIFAKDGSFVYLFGGRDGLRRNISYSGKWKLQGITVTLTVLERKDKEGGALADDPLRKGMKTIANFKEKITKINPSQEVSFAVTNYLADDPFNTGNSLTRILLNGIPYWKWHSLEPPKEKEKAKEADKTPPIDKKGADKIPPSDKTGKDKGKTPEADKKLADDKKGKDEKGTLKEQVPPKDKEKGKDDSSSLDKKVPGDKKDDAATLKQDIPAKDTDKDTLPLKEEKQPVPDKTAPNKKEGADQKAPAENKELEKTAPDKQVLPVKDKEPVPLNDKTPVPDKKEPEKKKIPEQQSPEKTSPGDIQVLKDTVIPLNKKGTKK